VNENCKESMVEKRIHASVMHLCRNYLQLFLMSQMHRILAWCVC